MCPAYFPATHPVHPAQLLIPFIQPSHSLPIRITQFSLTLIATQPSPTTPLPLDSLHSYLIYTFFLFFFFFFSFPSLCTAYYLTTLYYLYTPPITNMDSVPLITRLRSSGVRLLPPHLLQQSFNPHCYFITRTYFLSLNMVWHNKGV